MKKLIVPFALLAIVLSACAEAGSGNPLTPPTPRPATPTAEVARPPATPTTPGNPPSNPTAVPTAPGGGSTVGNPPSGSKVSNLCPSLAEARRLFGVDITLIGEEACAYTFNSGDGSFKPVNLPRGWLATTAEADQLVYVQNGDSSTGKIQAKAATWRLSDAYPGLSLEKQYELQTGYAALPQNQFQGSIRCRGCAGFAPLGAPAAAQAPGAAPAAAAPSAQSGCPSVANFKCEPIDGGYVYKADSPSTFNIPDGWKAYYGSPATWHESGSIPNARQVSLYQK